MVLYLFGGWPSKLSTKTTQNAPTPAQLANLFLQYARDDFSAIQNGTGVSGSSGGASSCKFTWDNPVQDYAAWCYEISMQINLPITLVVGSSSSVVVSPYAPYSALILQLLVGGAESIPSMSAVPFWIDEVTWARGQDPAVYGPSQNITKSSGSTTTAQIAQAYFGQWEWDGSDITTGSANVPPFTITTSSGQVPYPGATISTAGTYTYVFTFRVRMLLGRKMYGRVMEDLSGCIPLGDPSARPLLNLAVNTLVGTQPENNLFVNPTGTITATTTSAPTANVVWVAKTLDQLPQALNGKIPPPKCLMALEVDTNSGYAVPNAGQYAKLQVRTAMIYHKTIYALVNGGLPVTPDYFGFWYSDNAQNAREVFDATQNTMQELYNRYRKCYDRYLPKGINIHDFVGGRFPEFPRETPYKGLITPSTSLAAMAGLKPYPAAQGVIRIPSGTSISSAYCTTWSFGMVPVSY